MPVETSSPDFWPDRANHFVFSEMAFQPLFAKNICFRLDPNQMHIQTVLPTEGRYRDRHGRWETAAVDAASARAHEVIPQGRVS